MPKIFIAGTNTDIGKTFVCAWLCLHFGFEYFKPIQTGSIEDNDAIKVHNLSGCRTHPESYSYPTPCSPHLASRIEGEEIDFNSIQLPNAGHLIVEGAGGVLVPINDNKLVTDLISKFELPTIVVASSLLGTINHTLLTLEALRRRKIDVLGIIMNGSLNAENAKAIEFYGKIKILQQIPQLENVSMKTLKEVEPSNALKKLVL